MMSDTSNSGDESLDDLSWNPALQKMYADDKWAIQSVKIDEAQEDIAWELTAAVNIMNYEEMLLELFRDDEEPKTHRAAKSAVPESKFPYPKKSSMTRYDMERYLKLEKIFRKTQSFSELEKKHYKDYTEFKSLQSKVLSEQEECQRFLMDLSLNFLSEYNHVDSEADEWFEKRMTTETSRIRKYKQYYVHHKDFGIVFFPFKNDPKPCAIKHLSKALGSKRRLTAATLETPIPKSIKFPTRTPKRYGDRWKKCDVSDDVNAERLAIAWNADIVIGLSAMQTLADNFQPYQTEWEIPIVVKKYDGLDFDQKRTIAFVDKPLPPKRVAPREKNHIYFKEVFKHLSNAQRTSNEIPVREKSSKSKSVESEHSDENVIQVDGANDCGNSNKCNISEFGEKNPRQRVCIQKSTRLSCQSRFCDETIPQVDGGNDDLDTSTKTRSKEHGSKVRNAWLKPRKSSNSTNLADCKVQAPGSSEVEPFSGENFANPWAPARSNPAHSNSHSNDTSQQKLTPNTASRDASAELSFGVLPDSALHLPTNSSKSKSKRSKSNEEDPDNSDVQFTPRRSTRIKSSSSKSTVRKSSDDDAVQKHETRIQTRPSSHSKTPRKAIVQNNDDSESDNEPLILSYKKRAQNHKNATKAKSTRKAVVQNDDDSESDNEPLILSYKKRAQNNKNATKAKKNAPASERKKDGGNNSKSTADLPDTLVSGSDVLGQILGVSPTTAPSLKDISSEWAAQAEMMPNTDVHKYHSADDLSLHQPDDNDNVTYSLWEFGKVRVLIRYTLHGCLLMPNLSKAENSHGMDLTKPVGVSLRTKLEYQSDYTFEMLTKSELCRDWVTMLVKRCSKIVRARFDPLKRDMLDIEWTVSMNHLQDKAEKAGYNSAVTSKLLTKIFQTIADLDEGDYICSHREKEMKINVRKSIANVGKNVVYDLYKEYSNPGRSVVYANAPWVPGDPHKPRKFHIDKKIVPLMFEPREGPPTKGGARKTRKK